PLARPADLPKDDQNSQYFQGEAIEHVADLAPSLERLGLDRESFEDVCNLAIERFEEVLAQFE
ncbi:hypothetical protein K2X89_06110, partial [Myxococcota bacterium]|nr:hypothetical protein [Myxococcota bacterium]